VVGAISLDEFNRRMCLCWSIKIVSSIGMSWSLIVKVYCKVSIVCALGSAHPRPHDACVTVDNSTRQSLTTVPLHAMPPPCSPLLRLQRALIVRLVLRGELVASI